MVKSLGKTREVENIFNQIIYAGGLHLAMITPNPDEAKMDTLFYHCDALGSLRKMSKMDGSLVWSQWYFPFGEPLSFQDQNSHKFTGKELDDESGLYYFFQRYYDSNIGRFITLDPQGSTTSSLYAYCLNNPLKLIDPTGQQARDIREEVIPGWRGGKLYDVAFENWWAAKTQGWINPITARMSQMFPEIFFKGWWKQPHEIIREAMGLLRISRWGRSAWGQQVLKAFGKAKIEIGWLPPGVYGRTDPATGTVSLSHWLFTEEPQIEIIATLLTHEGGHVAKLIEERSEIEVREAGHETSVYFWGDIRGFSDVYVLSGNFSFEVFDVYNLLEDVWQARRHLPFEEYLKYIDILEGVIPP